MAEQGQAYLPEDIDYASILNLDNSIRCAVMTTPRNPKLTPSPIGALTQDHDLWSVRFSGNAGEYGLPRLELVFEIQHPSLGRMNLKIWWCPGVQAGNDRVQIEDMGFSQYQDSDRWYLWKQPHLLDGLEQVSRQRLFALKFTHNAASRSPISSSLTIGAVGLDPIVQQTLDHLFTSSDPCEVALWFVSPHHPFTMEYRYLAPLRSFVNHRIVPFAQYLHPNGEIRSDWKNLPMIQSTGKGMYVQGRSPNGAALSFYTFPAKTVFETHLEWALSVIVPVIRYAQWEQKKLDHLKTQTQLVLITKTEEVSIPGSSKRLRVPGDWYGLVRLMTVDDKVREVPDPGTLISVSFDESRPSSGEMIGFPQRSQSLTGRVIQNEELCDVTGTHFCINLTRQKDFTKVIHTSVVGYYDDDSLLSAWLEPKPDITSANRELDAAIKLTDQSFLPETLDKYRKILKSSLSEMPGIVEDFSRNNPQAWQLYLKEKFANCADNRTQREAIMSITHVTDGLVVVSGPPGAGKTQSLVDIVLGLCTLDYKALVVGPSTIAINKDAKETIKAYQELRPELQRKKKFLRLEVQGVELRAMVRVKDWMMRTSSDEEMKLPEFWSVEEIESDPEVLSALIAAAESFLEMDEIFQQQLVADLEDWEKAIERLEDIERRRDVGVPRLMTTGFHLYELSAQDKMLAAEEWGNLKCALLEDSKSESWISDHEAVHGPISQELKEAWGARAITYEEIQRRINIGRLKSESDRDRSYRYRQIQQIYIQQRGKLNKEQKKTFFKEWFKQLGRVLDNVDVLFTTCNNSGSDLFKLGFDADMLLVDEASQVNIPSLAVPLAASPKLKATWCFGDCKQLSPRDYAPNEFSEQTRVSSIALVEQKGWNILKLNVQYRMCPVISQFPARYFYQGNMINHPDVFDDSAYRKVFRQVTKDHYGQRGTAGSELIGINVNRGYSVAMANGFSMYNMGHAMAVAQFAIRLLMIDSEVPAEEIVILVYYSGQISRIEKFLRETAPNDDIRQKVTKIRIFTIDKFAGEQAQFILLDITVSEPRTWPGAYRRKRKGFDDEEKIEPPMWSPAPALSPYVKEPGRLCCAITRARAGLAIFCNYNTCVHVLLDGGDASGKALGDLVLDLHARNLIFDDETSYAHLPKNPWEIRAEEKWAASVERARSMHFMNQSFRKDWL